MISALLKGWWRTIGEAVESGRIELLTSPQLIAEFLEVVSRPSKQALLDPQDASDIANLLQRTSLVSPKSIPQLCRDPNDDFLLALADEGKADVLVTRDEDLLTIGSYKSTEIIHVADFLGRLSAAM